MSVLIIYIAFLIIYLTLIELEYLLARRINDFYIIAYSPNRRYICFKLNPALRQQCLPLDELEAKLNRQTSMLCKQLPPGTYYAVTHERIAEGLRRMQNHGRASIIYCKRKGHPKKQKSIYRNLYGRGFDTSKLPPLQMYKIKFNIP